jgi:carrier-protein-independent halogenase WelO5-like protein
MTFFRTETVAAQDAARSPDLLTRLRRREIDGVLVKGVYDRAACEAVQADLEHNRHGLIRTDFPASFAAFFYGINLNLAHPDLRDYFAAAPQFAAGLDKLFPGEPGLQERLTRLMSTLDTGTPYAPAPGPRPGTNYMFTTIRAHLPGGHIPPHFDDEQAARPSYRLLLPLIRHKLFSFVLAFTQAQEGGALEIFNLHPAQEGQRIAVGGRSAPKPDLDAVERVSFRLQPGDMIIVNSGHFLHRVTPVVGETVRWTACSFMAESKAGDRVYCWG